MKKFALCIVILTALLTAAACSTTPTPTRTVRWEAGEKLVYDVSFIPNPDDSPVYLEGEIKAPPSYRTMFRAPTPRKSFP